MFRTAVPPRIERCDPKTNAGLSFREAKEPSNLPDPLDLCGGERARQRRSLDWMCHQLAKGDLVTADELYYETDLVRVWEHHGYERAGQIIDRLAANQATTRT